MSNVFLPLVLLTLLSGTATHATGQVILYKGAGPTLWTASQVDSLILLKNEKVKSLGLRFSRHITKTYTRADTTINEYILQGVSSGVEANRKRYTPFIGQRLPAFALADLQGKRVNSAALVGKPVVLNLWFTSCAPCRAEMPTLNRIQTEKAATDVVFLALTYEPAQRVRAFLRQQAFTFRHVPDAKQYCAQFTTDYPISIFVDRNGFIQTILEGLPQHYDRVTKQPTTAVDDAAFYAALKQIE